MENIKLHYSRISRILAAVLVLNWAVAFAKIIWGFFTRCESMTADGLHSLSDGASNIIGLVGIAISSRPVDADHPYGHRKYETFFSLGIAMLLFFVAIELVKESIGRFANPVVPRVDLTSFIVMLVTIVVNMGVMRYEYRKGKELGSDILISDAMHTRADIFTSFTVIAALVSIRLGYPILDPIVTLVIAAFIGHTGVEIIKGASRILCDSVVIADAKKISNIVLKVSGVKTCHKIRTRGRPDDICIDLHVQVDPAMHIDQAHKISCAIEEAIKNGIQGVSDVLVHIEPKIK